MYDFLHCPQMSNVGWQSFLQNSKVNLSLGGLITIDARWRFIPIKIDLSQRNEISNNAIEYFMGGANIRYSRKII